MSQSARRAVLAAVVLSLPVLAQESGAAGSGPPPKPKPGPALTEAFKDAAGTWSCTGTMDNPQKPGTQVPTKSEMKIASEVDGFAYSGTFKSEKNAAMPAMKGHIHWGYDASKQKLVEFGFDNFGSTWSGTSDGQKDGATVWSEEGSMFGQPAKTRTTVTRKGPNAITVVTEIDNKGAWQKMGEDHCKKK
jgi:hypothetical protein